MDVRTLLESTEQQLKKQNGSESDKWVKTAWFWGKVIGTFLILLILYHMFTFKVTETQQAVVTRMGEIVRIVVDHKTPELVEQLQKNETLKDVKVVEGKGLKFKWPFIESVEKYTNKLKTYDTSPKEIVTKDKKRLIFDNYTQWRITNPALFKISVKNEANAQARLDDILYSRVREQIGSSEAHDLIANKEHSEKMSATLTANTNKDVASYGIEVIDVRVRRTDTPEENSKSIYTRMKTERDKIAKQYISEGEEEYKKVTSEANKEATILKADAYATSQKLIGEGDAQANKIYADAYNKDPEFYEFIKALDTYRATLKNGNTKMVIDPDSPLAKFLFGAK